MLVLINASLQSNLCPFFMLSLLIYLIISHQFLQIHQSLYFFSLYIIFRFKIFSLFPTRLVTLLNKTSYMLFPLNMIKYISCCSLSEQWLPWPAWDVDFNTSHVVVYPKSWQAPGVSEKFQYISCCSLSYLFDFCVRA